MAIPLLFIVPILTTTYGIGKGIKAGVDIKDAKDTNAEANNILENAKNELETHREYCSEALKDLGSKKLYILNNSIMQFINIVESIKNIELAETSDLDELSRFNINKKSFTELKGIGGYAYSLIGAYAALAVTGSALISPVIGHIVGAKANTQKEKAYTNLAEAKKTAEELASTALLYDGIRRRCNMFYNLLIRLDALFTPLVMQVQKIISMADNDYKKFSEQQKQTFAATFSLACAIKAVISTPILSDDGKLTPESENLIPKIQNQIKQSNQQIVVGQEKYLQEKLRCSNCGKVLPAGANFCTACGSKQ
ncbi:MAG: zinc ribbon domain-containing protein [Treponema sp.]|nr:zinc ribbon domain-containing protein [Treponema sp.]